jgi:hypothetical protein
MTETPKRAGIVQIDGRRVMLGEREHRTGAAFFDATTDMIFL